MDVTQLVADFGFPVVMVVGLGYFVYYVWQTITNTIDPAVQEMKSTIIRLTDTIETWTFEFMGNLVSKDTLD